MKKGATKNAMEVDVILTEDQIKNESAVVLETAIAKKEGDYPTELVHTFSQTKEECEAAVKSIVSLVEEDKGTEAYPETLKEGHKQLVSLRTGITKEGLGLRDGLNKARTLILDQEHELVEIVETEEKRLKSILKEMEEAAIRKDRLEKLPSRKERLLVLGIDDGFQLEDGVLTDEYLLSMDADTFEAFLIQQTSLKNDRDRVEIDRQRAEDERKANDARVAADAEFKAREEAILAKEKALKDEQEAQARIEQARIEERERAEREAKEKAEQAERDAKASAEKAERDRIAEEARKKAEEDEAERVRLAKEEELEKATKFKNLLAKCGWTPETAADFKKETTDTEVVIWKKVGSMKIK